VLADVVRDVTRLTQTPPDLAGMMVLGVIGAVSSRRVDVAIGRTHVEPMNLYGAVVSDSGTRKGPALRAVLALSMRCNRDFAERLSRRSSGRRNGGSSQRNGSSG
jgi:Protein of unknown function (DUF3987)